jgi:Fic family protein
MAGNGRNNGRVHPFDRATPTAEQARLIAQIDEFKGAWRALGVLAPERLSVLRRVATIESIGSSNRIEGNTLTDAEIAALLQRVDVRAFSSRHEQEVIGYAEAMALVFTSSQDLRFSENHIRHLHQTLLAHSERDEWHRGQYKTHPNTVAAFDADGQQVGIVFRTAEPFETPLRMAELVEWVRECEDGERHHALVVIAIATVVFLEIHPFQDGNGRLSRILTTLLLLRAGYVYVPYSSLESVIEQNKAAYYVALRRTQVTLRTETPDFRPWLDFFLRALVRQAERLRAQVEHERNILAPLPDLSLAILEAARVRGRLTMAEAIASTGASRGTLKNHFATLVALGHVARHGRGRGVWYELRLLGPRQTAD